MTALADPGRVIDLTCLDLFTGDDLHEVFAWLRANRPVYWNASPDGSEFWALTRYRDVVAAYADTARLSSRYGTVLGGSYRKAADSSSGRMLIASDAPEHRLLRQEVHRAFVPAVLDRAAAVIRGYCAAALDRMVADGGADFAQVALELPAGLLAVMFGLSRPDALHLLSLTRTMIGFRDARYHGGRDQAMTLVGAQVEIIDLMSALARDRRRRPADDLVSLLVRARVNGRPMTEDEILYNCLNVAVGGDETTPFTAAAMVEAFMAHPDQLDVLHAGPQHLKTALDEVLRWTSTNSYVQRVAVADTEIGGQPIRAGESVTLWNVSANRDETFFPDAHRFDVRRRPNRHVAFGVGPHRCIGRDAAWMELEILLGELVTRRLRFTPAGPVTRLRSNFMLGPTSLPVRVAAARRSRPPLRESR